MRTRRAETLSFGTASECLEAIASCIVNRVGFAGKTHFGPQQSFPFERIGGGQLKVAAMKQFIGRDPDQPYCLIVTSHSPHLPWSQGDASKYDANKLTLPPYVVNTPETRAALTRYYAEITDFDRELGQCMKLVRQSGQEDNTIFIYTSEQ